MRMTRREFGRQAVGSTATGLLLVSAAGPLAAEVPVSLQSFGAQVRRLISALEALGDAFAPATVAKLQKAMASIDEATGVAVIKSVLDDRVLIEVNINPEMRVSVRRGEVPASLIQGGWRTFLVRVNNASGATTQLTIRSPQGGPMGRRSSLAITGVHDFTNGAVDAVEARARWIALATYDMPPMAATLSGLALEYRILQVYSRDAGEREASLQADCGFGEQDLGFRTTLPVLFHCLPARRVPLHIRDEHGHSCVASLLITDAQGRVYPALGKRALPDLAFESQIYRADSEALMLPDGAYTIDAGRGPEYLRQRLPLAVSAGAPSVSISLKRWVEPARYGYYSGDTHIHAAGCSHYESPAEGVTPEVMLRQIAGEALDLGAVLNWGPGYEYQKQFFSGSVADTLSPLHRSDRDVDGSEPVLPYAPLMRYDVEVSGFPSSHCGHLVLLRLKQNGFPGAATLDDWPSWNLPILRWAKSQGALTGYAHVGHGLVVNNTELPNFLMPPFNSMGANEFLVDVTFPGVIDFLSGCDLWPFAELNVWYHALNCGFRTAFAGETDFPCITDECVGGGRSYVRLPASIAHNDSGYSAWLEALVARDSYFGDGRSHIFGFSVATDPALKSERRGQDLHIPSGNSVRVTAKVCAWLDPSPDDRTKAIATASPFVKPYWHIERARVGSSRRVGVELIVNGRAVGRIEVLADGSVQPVDFTHMIEQSSWIALRILPSAHTNPVVVEVAASPVRASRRSAAWCRQAVDVCWEQKRTRIRASELAAAAEAYNHARATYDSIIKESVTE